MAHHDLDRCDGLISCRPVAARSLLGAFSMPLRFRSIAPPPTLVFTTLLAIGSCVDDTLDETDGGVPGTCSAGIPAGNKCTQRTASVGSVVHARGLSSLEGRVVKAAFTLAFGSEVKTTTTVVSGGAFDLDFLFASTACNLGASFFGAGAFYIDADADGACDPAVDRMFVWGAWGGPGGTCSEIEFTPQSPACKLGYSTSGPALTAAQTICPAVGSCFAFCGSQNPQNWGTGGTQSGLCADAGTDGPGS
jgi:hypothetical protein